MRSLALFFALALLATPVLASDLHAPDKDDDICTRIAKIAGSTMALRQSGVPLSDQLQDNAWVAEATGMSEAIQYIVRTITIDAYDTPRFHSKKYREYAEMEYRNKVHVACLRWMGG